MTNFGASFKKARESKGISLEKIAAETRISTRFLTAIENEDFHLLPGGIFNRGFVRAYAEKVGLDPVQAIADYERLAEVREPIETETVASVEPTRVERHLYPLAIGILALVIVIFYAVTRDPSSKTQSPIATPPTIVTPPATQPPATQPSQVEPPSTPPQTTAAAAEPEAAPGDGLTLDIEAHAQTWVRVITDGKSNPGEILEPGMTRKFTAQTAIRIGVGNAGGLTLKLNSQPMKPLGKSGQIRQVTITPENLKDFIS